MLKFIAKRLANYVVMLFVAISCTYFLASGFMNYQSRTPRPPAASINRSLDLANINDHTNIFTRYWRWLTGVVTRWDWGLSPDLGSVNGALAPRIVASTELVTIATVLSIVLGVALGIYTAQRQYKWQDRLFGTTATFFLVIPTAVFALLVVMLAIFINGASGFRLFYVTGLSSYTGNNWFLRLADFGQHIILPTIVLTILGMVSYHLTQRTYLLDEMHADYVRTARAKGVSGFKTLFKHALRNAILPVVTVLGPIAAGVLTGAFVVENIFAIPGLGRYLVQSVQNRDYFIIMGTTIFLAALVIAINVVVDILYKIIDPRIKLK